MAGTTQRPAVALALIAFFGLLTVLTVGGFLLPWRPELASEEGHGIDGTITYLLVVTGILVILGHAVLVRFLWGSSTGEEAVYGRPSRRAEWLWSLIPVLAMLGLSEAGVLLVSGPVWDSLYVKQPRDPVLLEVVGKQFEWYVHYPGEDGIFGEVRLERVDEAENLLGLDERKDKAARDDIVKRGHVYLPSGRPVVIRLRTYDVLHSFFVPAFRVKQDLLPGHPTRIKFTPNRVGNYELACAELCGLGHYTMKGEVHVVPPEEFEAWLRKQPRFGG